jgi:hypothetical protein
MIRPFRSNWCVDTEMALSAVIDGRHRDDTPQPARKVAAAKAGIQPSAVGKNWMPACAGMSGGV